MRKFISFGNSPAKGRHISLCGVPLPLLRIPTLASRAYAKRFEGLTEEEERSILEAHFREHLGRELNLDSPVDFNEKMAWLKLYYHNPLMTKCADKVCARDYFLSCFPGESDRLVEQIGVYKSSTDIDPKQLPDSFVLKSNWGSGCQMIVRNKRSLDFNKVKRQIAHWTDVKSNHYYDFLEWGYKNISPRIVCEELLDFDYKIEFFCFSGEVKFFWVVLDDKTERTRANFYELDWSQIPVSNHYPNFHDPIDRPPAEDYARMLEMSRVLSGDFPFVRCDFYKTRTGFRFSEMTFFHWGGTCDFTPSEFGVKVGGLIKLPPEKWR